MESFSESLPKSATLLLLNLFTPEEVSSTETLEDALADCRIELEQHGKLENLRIIPATPFSSPGDSLYQMRAGFVYATYSSPEEAETVQRMLAGRKFNGRVVISSILPADE